MRLYEISQEYVQFLRMVEDEQIPQDAIADTLDSIKGEFEVKADNIACVVKKRESFCYPRQRQSKWSEMHWISASKQKSHKQIR